MSTSDPNHNRIACSVTKMEERLEFTKITEPQKLAVVETTATITDEEWWAFAPKASVLRSHNVITLDESMTLHSIHTRWCRNATLAERMVFLQIMQEAFGR